jgi:hypothetical protein
MNASGMVQPRSAGDLTCSTRSLQAGETVAGTASYGRRWLLLEVASAWGPNAFRGSSVLDRALGIKIEQRAAAEGFRLVAIRRSGRARLDGGLRWRWARVDCTPGHESVRWGEAAGPDEYLTTVYSDPGTPSAEPVIAVCAHGRHDQCCATRGRLVATLLARREGPAVWECSHIGGDRFAATLLLFPHGINYGHADVLDAGQMVDEYRAGRVMLDGLRGRSAYRFLEQTAQDAARRTFGDLRIEAYEPLNSVLTAPGHWRVLLTDPAAGSGRPTGRIQVELAEAATAPLFSNCAATVPLAVPTFAVQSIAQLT